MCEYCEKEKEKYPDDKYGVICPREAGRSMGSREIQGKGFKSQWAKEGDMNYGTKTM